MEDQGEGVRMDEVSEGGDSSPNTSLSFNENLLVLNQCVYFIHMPRKQIRQLRKT